MYKINYNEDWQKEYVYKIAQIYKPQNNKIEEQWFSNLVIIVDNFTLGKLTHHSCNLAFSLLPVTLSLVFNQLSMVDNISGISHQDFGNRDKSWMVHIFKPRIQML